KTPTITCVCTFSADRHRDLMPSRFGAASVDVIAEHVITAVILNGLAKCLNEIVATQKSLSTGVLRKQLERAVRVLSFPLRLSRSIELGVSDIIRMSESTFFRRWCARSSRSQVDSVDSNLSIVHHSPEIVVCQLHLIPVVGRASRFAH